LFYSGYQCKSDGTLLGAQVVGILFVAGWVGAVMFPLFVWFDWKGWFRSGALEVVGLDTSYHYGNMVLINGKTDHDVNPDYIAAYKRKPQYYLRRRAAVPNASGHTISESRAETLSGDSLGKSV
jgi:hypothetical protein